MADFETVTDNGGAPDDAPGLPGLPQPAPAQQAASAYRVLARKYRPRAFPDLIGQEAMVRTLSNAFETGRIPQAWMLTGVRGVGKTTTARILARALNYERPGVTGPTVHMPELGVHCEAIMESRHVDVMEMDAASHTGIDDVRQIIDGIRYAPVSARYKVYIIDEVHMLSEKAFNAFLKTLEEPPPHAKFIFATTEIRKVPVTILSRCQRFDLRRVEAGTLVAHLTRICAAEQVQAEPEALAMIARAAEGSVRDSLSLLDQAIAHGAGRVGVEEVRAMLGLADRGRIVDLFEHIMRGDLPAALGELKSQYDAGADPAVVLTDLASFTHFVTRLKLVPAAADDAAITDVERTRGAEFAARLSIRVLSRTWQMLVKGIAEVQAAPRPIAAAEMVLVRLAYAADLPTPDEALRLLRQDHEVMETLGLRAGGFAYSTDVVRFPPETLEALRGLDTWIVGCFQRGPHKVHADLPTVLGWVEALRPRRTVLTHMSHDLDYATLRRTLPPGVEADDVKATFSDGVLEISIPKPKAEEPETKRIEISRK